MARVGRADLKKRFQTGRMPSEMDFADLIESMLNCLDEGFDKSQSNGLKVTQLMGCDRNMM
jgi:hypothetical protein